MNNKKTGYRARLFVGVIFFIEAVFSLESSLRLSV